MARRVISEALKAEAVHQVVTEGRSVAQVCQLLGVGETAVRRWVTRWWAQQDPPDRTPAQTQADRQKIMALEAEVARLEEERDLLKKSIAFFVRENDRPRR